MIELKIPVCSPATGDDVYASFLKTYESEEKSSPVVFASEDLSLRFCSDAKSSLKKVTTSRLTKLIDESSCCPELRKVAEAARKAASTRDHKPHGFAEHIIGMSASLLGIALLASLIVGVLGVCAIVIGVLIPFQLI